MKGESDGFAVRQNGEVSGLQQVKEEPHGLVNYQELRVVNAVFLLCRAELPGKEGERLPGVWHSLLEDGTHGSGWSVRDQSEWSGWVWMSQEIGL
jgi:hypothetical protein